ncbi:MAG: SDR family NAD(P)-dependent oxidoreductase [Alphaproteobacteria bacterium]|jgi:NAD(P)-dependent dehydrogenase (short-subunit alcohol dehydrogenase family)|nr:SDR family NAD(P)-dependent oxidoreductase [Alphaproteobacteria bacterium]
MTKKYKLTALQVAKGVDLTNKNVIITGGYSGVGLETLKALSQAKANIIVPARNIEKAKQSLANIKNVTIEYCDLMDLSSVEAFANKFLETKNPLHILINCAGIMATPFAKSKDGFESQFATNHLAHFLLTAKLYPALKQANGARVVNVSSRGHRLLSFGSVASVLPNQNNLKQNVNSEQEIINFNNMEYNQREYNAWESYGLSKTANILFSLQLDNLAKKDNIRAFSVHPGLIPQTNLAKHLQANSKQDSLKFKLAKLLPLPAIINFTKLFKNIHPADRMKTNQQGAATVVYAAISNELNNQGGIYLEDCAIAPVVPNNSKEPFGVREYAYDVKLAKHLWEVSEKYTKTKFEIA